jgi:hypothetical protein
MLLVILFDIFGNDSRFVFPGYLFPGVVINLDLLKVI